ncbi:hypothetical protein HORIV_65810 [Vreelandella olivaria]|uniref:Uncharacterized protein n=1 Tax=Vreelandella olivaria TaxID=390919 RepID=A0ABM7GTY8_9GAMM|nr:hypothetical protein HORIV_65810 [Halomonas olivaria]
MAATGGFPPVAAADVPRVAVDIPPVYSLVSKVMGSAARLSCLFSPALHPMVIHYGLLKRNHSMMLIWSYG